MGEETYNILISITTTAITTTIKITITITGTSPPSFRTFFLFCLTKANANKQKCGNIKRRGICKSLVKHAKIDSGDART